MAWRFNEYQDWSAKDSKWPFSDQKGGNKLLSVAEISARQVLCCYQMLLPDGAGVARSLSLRLDATRWTSQKSVYPPPSPSPAVVLLMYSDSVLYAVSLFGWYIVLLLSVHVSVGVYCTDSGLCGLFSPPQKTANTVPLHTYQRMFFASAIAATDK